MHGMMQAETGFGLGHNRPPPLVAMRRADPQDARRAEPRDARSAKNARSADEAVAAALGAVVSLSSLQAAYGSCHVSGMPELDTALVNPAAVFASPDEVLRHPLLTIDCKREILWRWAWDEYLIELAAAEGMPDPEPSRLPEVKDALRVLGTEWSPDPAAPAAFLVRYHFDGMRLAA